MQNSAQDPAIELTISPLLRALHAKRERAPTLSGSPADQANGEAHPSNWRQFRLRQDGGRPHCFEGVLVFEASTTHSNRFVQYFKLFLNRDGTLVATLTLKEHGHTLARPVYLIRKVFSSEDFVSLMRDSQQAASLALGFDQDKACACELAPLVGVISVDLQSCTQMGSPMPITQPKGNTLCLH